MRETLWASNLEHIMKKELIWEFDGKNSIKPRHPRMDPGDIYNVYNIIIWRSIIIEIVISKSRGGLPVSSEYIFIVNKKTYHYSGIYRFRGAPGSGDIPESILSGDYILKFLHEGEDFRLREENINYNNKMTGETVNPFLIITPEYPLKAEGRFKRHIYRHNTINKKSIFDDNPIIEIDDEGLTFDNGKLIYGAEDIYIRSNRLELLYELFSIELHDRTKLLEKLNEKYLNDFQGFIEFIKLSNIPFQRRRL